MRMSFKKYLLAVALIILSFEAILIYRQQTNPTSQAAQARALKEAEDYVRVNCARQPRIPGQKYLQSAILMVRSRHLQSGATGSFDIDCIPPGWERIPNDS